MRPVPTNHGLGLGSTRSLADLTHVRLLCQPASDKGLRLRLGRTPVIHECDIPRVFEACECR